MLYAFDGCSPIMGVNTYISETAQVIGNVSIGDNCYIGHGTIVRGDYGRIVIGAGSAIEEAAVMHAPPGEILEVGESVTVGHGAIIHGKRIGRCAVIGMGAILSLRTETGEWSIVGEGSVVPMKKAIPPRVVAVGNPAKVIRAVNSADTDLWEMAKRLYVDLAKKYLEKGMKEVLPVRHAVNGNITTRKERGGTDE